MVERRTVLKAGLAATFAYTVGGTTMMLTPREARARDAALRVLSSDQAEAFAALGDGLAPGADEAGMAHYLDVQLSLPRDESLLMIRNFDVPPPWTDFYLGGLEALESAARGQFKRPLIELDEVQMEELIGKLFADELSDWTGPPASLFYLVLRSDAVDVTYGTEAGFERLDIEYLAHIRPPEAWT